MQWFGVRKEESPEDFWRETAARRGGEIGFITYAVLAGASDGRVGGMGGLLYTVGDTVWFEDFEHDNWFARIIGARSRYQKTELSFAKPDVRLARLVARSTAQRCLAGRVRPGEARPASTLSRILSSPLTQVLMMDGSALFFDVMLRDEFLRLFGSEAENKT
jgi:hypothetical protein